MAAIINGATYSWGGIEIQMLGAAPIGVTKIQYKQAQEMEAQYGIGNEPIGAGIGRKTYEGSIGLTAEELAALEAIAPEGDITQIDFFPIVVSYEAGNKVHTHTLVDCKFKENGRDVSSGDATIEAEIPLFISQIKWK